MHHLAKLTLSMAMILTGLVHANQESTESSSKVRSNQEGPSQFLVTCFESPQFCAEEFKRLCPDGHRVEGYFIDEFDHGQITARISCIVPPGN